MEQMQITHSEELYSRAKELMPGGVNSPVRAFQSVGGTPRFIQRAKDQYLYDEDGNAYIDYIGSWGPMILGHNPDVVLEAVRSQLENGLSYGAATALEVEMAELIHEIVPCVEMMRMVNSGTEAVMSAVRAARGFVAVHQEPGRPADPRPGHGHFCLARYAGAAGGFFGAFRPVHQAL